MGKKGPTREELLQRLRQLEQRLRGAETASEATQREILRLASFPLFNPNPVLEMDGEGRITFCNQAALKVTEGKEVSDPRAFLPGDWPEIVLTANQTGERAFQREVPVNGEVFLETLSFDQALNVWRIYAINITQRRQAETALLRAKEDWERTFDAVPDLIAILDTDHHLVRVNRAMAEALGRGPKEMAGKFCYQYMHQDLCISPSCPHNLMLQDHQEHSAEIREWGRDFLVTASPIFDEQEKLIGSVHLARDITASKAGEEALKLSHAKLELALREAQRRRQETESLLLASRTVMEKHTFQEAAWEIFQQCKAMTGAAAGYIALLSPDGAENEVLFLDAGGLPCNVNPELPMPIRGLREEAYRTGRAVFDNAFASSPHTAFLPRGHVVLENVLFAPMLHEGQAVGLIGLANKPEGFTADDGRLAGGFADLAAIALVSRRNEEKLQQAQTQLEQRVKQRTVELENTVAQLEAEVRDRLQAESALDQERQRFYEVLEMLPASVVLLTPDYLMPYANRYFTERFGKPQGLRCFEYLFGRTEPCETCETFKVLETKESHRWEWTGPDGRFYDVHDFPFTDADGSPLIMEMGLDITERKQAEKRLVTINRLYRVLSQVNETIVRAADRETLFQETCRIAVEEGGFRMAWVGLSDEEGRLINPVARYGHDEGYLDNLVITMRDGHECRGPTGTSIREGKFDICNDFAEDPRMEPWRKKALARGYRSSGAFPLRVGELVIGALNIYADQPNFFNEEEIALLESLTEDLSFALESMEREAARRRAEAEVQMLNEELERRVKERTAQLEAANQEMEAFSYSVSHDLKAPIRAIDGFSKMLLAEHGDNLDAEARRLMGVVRQNTAYMARLIDDLLALSRLGRQQFRQTRLDLAAMKQAAFREVRRHYPEQRVELTIKELPPACGDPSLMHQVLVNLLSNACKFTRYQDPARLEIGGWAAPKENIFYVKDNGIGFDMQYQDKLFGVFQRLHGPGEFEGTGVGLAIVQRILLRHRGRVWAEGKTGEGATFYFSLPAVESEN